MPRGKRTRAAAAVAAESADRVEDRFGLLDADLLMCIMDQSDCRSLARLALTSHAWAQRLVPALPMFWKKRKDVDTKIATAATFDEMEEVLQWLAERGVSTRVDGLAFPEFDINEFRDEERFQQLYVARGLSRCGFRNVDECVEKRLDVFKASLEVVNVHGLHVRDDTLRAYRELEMQQLLATAITTRLAPADFICVVKTWRTQEEYEFDGLLADLLACNVRRAEFTNGDLAQCVQMCLELLETQEDDEDASVHPGYALLISSLGQKWACTEASKAKAQAKCFKSVIGGRPWVGAGTRWISKRRSMEIAYLTKPLDTSKSCAQFYFSRICYERDDYYYRQGLFRFKRDTARHFRRLVAHASALSLEQLLQFVSLTGFEELARIHGHNGNHESYFITALRSWATFNDFPNSALVADEELLFSTLHSDFFEAVDASQSMIRETVTVFNDLKKQTSVLALEWISRCKSLATAKRVAGWAAAVHAPPSNYENIDSGPENDSYSDGAELPTTDDGEGGEESDESSDESDESSDNVDGD